MFKLYNMNIVKATRLKNPKVHNFADHKVVNFWEIFI